MSHKRDALGDRMKGYEYVSRTYLPRRIPVVIRVDGKAFHTFTRGLKKPFDRILMTAMQDTMKALCENIQGCVFGYTQSDEITLVLTDYKTITTDAWFGYNVQKMASIAGSMATLAFASAFSNAVYFVSSCSALQDFDVEKEYLELLSKKSGALFDARAFSVPKDEVCNCLIWRQQDATRNSIESVGQAYFSQKQLDKKNTSQIQEMLWSEFGINWNDFPTDCKRGSCCYRVTEEREIENPKTKESVLVKRRKWIVDTDPPIFTKDREYVTKWL